MVKKIIKVVHTTTGLPYVLSVCDGEVTWIQAGGNVRGGVWGMWSSVTWYGCGSPERLFT